MTREILLLCEYPALNGGERSMLATFDAVRAAGFTPAVLAPPDGPLADELAARGVEHTAFQCWKKGDSPHLPVRPAGCCAQMGTVPFFPDETRIPQSQLREELARILHARRPALLHANSLAMGRLSGPVAAELQLPSIAHLRDIVNLSAQAVADLNCHTRLLAVSHATRTFHATQGVVAEKTHVLYNGVDLEEFRPRPPTGYLQRELGLSPHAQLIGTIGQLGLRKGQDVLLRAAAVVAGSLPDVHSLIVGERNSDKDESRRFESDLHSATSGPLASRVHFLGHRTDVGRMLGELTMLVHPARQEPLGRVLLEAAAAGLAVVATNVGGTAEIFPPGCDAARLVPPDDADALAAAMLELLGNPAMRVRLAAAARRRAEEQFDIRTAADNLLGHYRATAV